MLRLNVNNETSKLKAVVLGIGNSLGSVPTANECYDPKSRFHVLNGTYPKEIDIISQFLTSYPNISCSKQIGEETFYQKRTSADGELDISKTIQENFNLLRVGNNDAWPSFFYYKGVKYILKIFKDE